jgi:hypothetical protein
MLAGVDVRGARNYVGHYHYLVACCDPLSDRSYKPCLMNHKQTTRGDCVTVSIANSLSVSLLYRMYAWRTPQDSSDCRWRKRYLGLVVWLKTRGGQTRRGPHTHVGGNRLLRHRSHCIHARNWMRRRNVARHWSVEAFQGARISPSGASCASRRWRPYSPRVALMNSSALSLRRVSSSRSLHRCSSFAV